MIKLSIFRWEDYSGLPGLFQCNHKAPYKRELGGQSQNRHYDKETQRKRLEEAIFLALKMKNGTTSQEMLMASRS